MSFCIHCGEILRYVPEVSLSLLQWTTCQNCGRGTLALSQKGMSSSDADHSHP